MAHASSRATVRSVLPSFALGAVTGPLWAPCAGPPVLGLVLTTAALQGPSTQTTLLHVAYAAGPSRIGDIPISDAMTSNDSANTAFYRLAQR